MALALTVGLETANFVSGGEMYLANLQLLAQDTGGTLPPPPPPPPQESVPPPMPMTAPEAPSTTVSPSTSTHEGTMPAIMPPPMPPSTSETHPPMMPPPPYQDGGMQPPVPYYNRSGGTTEPSQSHGEGGFMETLPRGGDSGLEHQNEKPPMMPPPLREGGFMNSLPRGGDSGLEHQVERSKMMPPPPPSGGPRQGGKSMYPQPPSINPFGGMPKSGQGNFKMMPPPSPMPRGGGNMPPSGNMMKQFGSFENKSESGGFENENFEGEEENNSLDQRELSQVLAEIKKMQGDVRRLQSQVKKSGLGGDIAQKLSDIAADLQRFQGALAGSGDDDEKLDAIHEFRNGEYNEAINEIRSMVEVPQEIKKFSQTIKRLEKIVKTKVIKNLGVDLGRVNADIAEMKQTLQEAQNALNGGDYEEARSALQDFHSEGGPKEIESALFGVRDAKTYLKRVRDSAVKSKLEGIIQEAINLINNGEYRDAKEYMEARMVEIVG